MRRLLLVLLLASSALAQRNDNLPLVVQSNTAQNGSISYNDAVVSGNELVGCVAYADQTASCTNGTITGVTDTRTTTYTIEAQHICSNAGHCTAVQCFHGPATSSGSNTVTYTGVANTSVVGIAEYKNLSDALDGAVRTSCATSTVTSSTNSFTSGVNGDMAVSGIAGNGASTNLYTRLPDQTLAGQGTTFGFNLAQQPLGIAGSYGVTSLQTSNTLAPRTSIMNIVTMLLKAPAIVVGTSHLPDGGAGTAYAAQLTGAGGTGAYTWACTGLPAFGLSLNTSTGVISGTPSTSGTLNLGCTVTDGTLTSGTDSLTLGIGSSLDSVSLAQTVAGTGIGTVTLTGVGARHLLLFYSWGPETNGSNVWLLPAAGATNNISDTFNSTWFRVSPPSLISGPNGPNGAPLTAFAACSAGSGSDTITYNGGLLGGVLAQEYSGAQIPWDDGSFGHLVGYISASGFNLTTGNFNAQVPNEMLVAVGVFGQGGLSPVIAAPFTTDFNTTLFGGQPMIAAHDLVTTATNYTANVTGGVSQPNADAQTINLQLVGLRPKITGLACGATPVGASGFAHAETF